MLRRHRAARPIAAIPGPVRLDSTILPLSYVVRESKVDRVSSFSSVLRPPREIRASARPTTNIDRRQALARLNHSTKNGSELAAEYWSGTKCVLSRRAKFEETMERPAKNERALRSSVLHQKVLLETETQKCRCKKETVRPVRRRQDRRLSLAISLLHFAGLSRRCQ
jgi:hypothetical protein